MFDELLKANEATLFERFITRCASPSLLLTALLHADFDARPAYLLVWGDPPVPLEPYRGLTCSGGPVRRIQSRRSSRAAPPACCARSTTAPAGVGSSRPPRPPPPPASSLFYSSPPPRERAFFFILHKHP